MKRILLRSTLVLVALALLAGLAFFFRPISCMLHYAYLREALGGVESHTLSIEGHTMHYLVEGPKDGPAVVLVHGLGGSAEDWRQLAPLLAKAGYRVYSPELFGYGRSDKPADFSYSPQSEADAVVAFLDDLHLGPINLGGWSMGGWIVQLIAAEHSEHVHKLILFDSVGLYQPPTWDTRLFIPKTASELDQLEALLMPHPQHAPGFVVRDILRFSEERGWVIQRALNAMLSGKETTDHLLPTLKMPVLIVWGTADHIAPLSEGSAMHALIPQSEMVLAPECGHLAPRQCVSTYEPQLEAFLKR
ncbi:alpha/beta fold hydrolase [Telmatobacter bradus]|uniref:alpha/beta fold hydrolase n=1 Tax=Telmatobacter bradus TaxID=474953 RepID=UPI003B42F02F